MSSIDKYAYLSKLNHVSPALKCFAAVFSMTVCLGFDHWLFSVLIWLCMSFMTVYKGGLSARRYGKLLLYTADIFNYRRFDNYYKYNKPTV